VDQRRTVHRNTIHAT